MWKRIAPLLIVLSVALNLAFVGTWVAHIIREHAHHGAWFVDKHNETIWCPLHRKLGTDQQQWKQIEPTLAEFRKSSQAICEEVNRKRQEMIDLIAVSQPDRQAIAAKQEEILAGQRKMQELVIGQLLAEKQVLNAQQQKELFDLLRQRNGCPGHGPMMGLPGSEDATCPHQDNAQSSRIETLGADWGAERKPS
jgi:Spy/CpxP family protein refolding chaperone